ASRPANEGQQRAGLPIDLGFASVSDLFSSSEHDRVGLDDGTRPGLQAMRWSFDYSRGRFQWILKRLERAALRGARSSRCWVRSDAEGPILVQMSEASGEAFFAIVRPSRNWSEVRLELDDFQVDQEKRRDGTLQPEDVVEILVA